MDCPAAYHYSACFWPCEADQSIWHCNLCLQCFSSSDWGPEDDSGSNEVHRVTVLLQFQKAVCSSSLYKTKWWLVSNIKELEASQEKNLTKERYHPLARSFVHLLCSTKLGVLFCTIHHIFELVASISLPPKKRNEQASKERVRTGIPFRPLYMPNNWPHHDLQLQEKGQRVGFTFFRGLIGGTRRFSFSASAVILLLYHVSYT